MTALMVQVSDDQKAFIDAKVSTGHFTDSGEYLCRLIKDAMKAEKMAALEKLLLERIEAVEKGDAREMTAADWQCLKEDLLRRHGNEGKKHAKTQSGKTKAG